ncbi:MAG: hypothetical protein HC865_04915 [Cyanobacteria bacterium RU_5_0]|nr:hypothetical protein [Cyanobacteria bacterium RU_5_0]
MNVSRTIYNGLIVNFLLILPSVGADTWVCPLRLPSVGADTWVCPLRQGNPAGIDFAIGRGRHVGLPSTPGQPRRDCPDTTPYLNRKLQVTMV